MGGIVYILVILVAGFIGYTIGKGKPKK